MQALAHGTLSNPILDFFAFPQVTNLATATAVNVGCSFRGKNNVTV
jgi:hypothetical protein